MPESLVTVAYIVAGLLFIMSLSGLSAQATAARGNIYGIVGMAIAAVATALSPRAGGYPVMAGAMAVGSAIGAVLAARVQMTSMPQLVAILHSFVGAAAVLVGLGGTLDPTVAHTGVEATIHQIETFVGVFVGAITFTGSVVAYGKLQGLIGSKPLLLPARHLLNLGLAAACVVFATQFIGDPSLGPLLLTTAVAGVLGVHLVMAIGGADMPVVVSMLNSYSGWAAAAAGFMLNNDLLIITGALVGSSGAILSYIMCKAMNRSFFNVILGGFGAEPGAAVQGAQEQRPVKSGSADDAAFVLGNAETVVIVPGYGLAVARAQHAVKELAEKLTHKGITVKYAIHPVAGRMPGHMNVLLAEAEVPYDQVFEMEDINGEFGQVDVAIVLGANDVVNPAALQKGTPIYGMPILEAYKAKTIIVNKRSMAAGYAGLDNELFYMDKTMMVFGDAKKVVEDMVKAVE